MANNSADWDFFLTHAGADKEKAEALYEYLADKSRVFLSDDRRTWREVWRGRNPYVPLPEEEAENS